MKIKLIDINSEKGKYSFENKVNILQCFWNERDRNLVRPGIGSGLIKQKMLVFYNLFSYVNQKQYDFSSLEAFEEGPVYKDIFIKVKHERVLLEQLSLPEDVDPVNEDEFLTAMYMMEANSGVVLSKLSHVLDLWEQPWARIDKKITHVDISDSDRIIINDLFLHYSYMRDNYNLYETNNGKIAINKLNFDDIISNNIEEINSIDCSYGPVMVDKVGEVIQYG